MGFTYENCPPLSLLSFISSITVIIGILGFAKNSHQPYTPLDEKGTLYEPYTPEETKRP